MGRISQRFEALKRQGRKGLVVYLMGGDPNVPATEATIEYLEQLGVDFIEIGVPFSDPLADGPTIQEAGQRALGTTLTDLIEMLGRIRNRTAIPLLFMSYYNPILHRKADRFVSEAAEAGLDGLIVPDLTPEEGGDLIEWCRNRGVDYVPLLAPTTTNGRIDLLASQAGGFLYYVSRTGTTGVRNDISADLQGNVQRIRARSDLPIAVGFGISRPDQAEEVSRNADAVVIGSAVVKCMAEAGDDLNRTKQSLAALLEPVLATLHKEKKK